MRSAESRIREDESVYEFPVCYSRYSTLFLHGVHISVCPIIWRVRRMDVRGCLILTALSLEADDCAGGFAPQSLPKPSGFPCTSQHSVFRHLMSPLLRQACLQTAAPTSRIYSW